jgi:hypothetical protein
MRSMRIDFLGHASLLIRSGDLTLLCDPWWDGPAYARQWYPWPLPVPDRYDLSAVDAIYISHGHEDHLHEATLRSLTRRPTVVIARSFDVGNRDGLRSLGFGHVEEVASGRSLVLERGRSRMKLTLFTYLGDSMLAVEADGQVLLNLNDALHCVRRDTAAAYCRILRERFPRVDYLFCGFGGASYFPNCFRLPGKDDVAVARRREEFFVRNLGLIAQHLGARMVFPFAAHFILPDERNFWISRVRLGMPRPRELLTGAFQYPEQQVWDLEPGDYVENGRVEHTPAAPVTADEARAAVLARWPDDPERPIERARFSALVERLGDNARGWRGGTLDARISLRDFPSGAIQVRARAAGAEVIAVDPDEPHDAPLTVETRLEILEGAARHDYGRDLICIGYGAIFNFRSPEAVRERLHERLLAATTRFPSWRERLSRHPVMCMSYLVRDTGARLALRQRLQRHPPPSEIYSVEQWL